MAPAPEGFLLGLYWTYDGKKISLGRAYIETFRYAVYIIETRAFRKAPLLRRPA